MGIPALAQAGASITVCGWRSKWTIQHRCTKVKIDLNEAGRFCRSNNFQQRDRREDRRRICYVSTIRIRGGSTFLRASAREPPESGSSTVRRVYRWRQTGGVISGGGGLWLDRVPVADARPRWRLRWSARSAPGASASVTIPRMQEQRGTMDEAPAQPVARSSTSICDALAGRDLSDKAALEESADDADVEMYRSASVASCPVREVDGRFPRCIAVAVLLY